MSTVITGDTWTRRGISLLWDPDTLSSITEAKNVLSVRQYLNYYKTVWPEELQTANGYAMVAAGLETILDVMEPSELIEWLEKEFYRSLLSFQNMYEGQCALIFWLPGGQKRVEYKADGIFYWTCSGPYHGEQIPLSSCLWNGAASDAKIIAKGLGIHDVKDKGCIGIYHPRIS